MDIKQAHRVLIDGSIRFLREVPKEVKGYKRTSNPRVWVKEVVKQAKKPKKKSSLSSEKLPDKNLDHPETVSIQHESNLSPDSLKK